MKLIEDWKVAHKLWSVRFAGVTAALAGMDWLLPNLVGVIPGWLYLLLAALIAGSRIVAQEPKNG